MPCRNRFWKVEKLPKSTNKFQLVPSNSGQINKQHTHSHRKRRTNNFSSWKFSVEFYKWENETFFRSFVEKWKLREMKGNKRKLQWQLKPEILKIHKKQLIFILTPIHTSFRRSWISEKATPIPEYQISTPSSMGIS